MAEHRSFVVGSRIRLSTKKEGAPYLAPSFFVGRLVITMTEKHIWLLKESKL